LIYLKLNPWPLVANRLEAFPRGSASLKTMAIVDTGCEMSMVTNDVFDQLGVTEGGVVKIRSVGSALTEPQPRALMTLTILSADGREHWSNPILFAAGFGGEHNGAVRCLMGLDVLKYAKLILEGHLGSATLEFPGY
jgi:hypothetical protein